MPKFGKGGKSLAVQLQPRSDKQAEEVERLRTELEHIARLTTAGGVTDLTKMMWCRLIEECKDRANPFLAVEASVKSLADAYEAEMKARFKKTR